MELLGDIFLPWVAGYLAARFNSLFAARYFGALVCLCQYRRHGRALGQRFYADFESLYDLCMEWGHGFKEARSCLLW